MTIRGYMSTAARALLFVLVALPLVSWNTQFFPLVSPKAFFLFVVVEIAALCFLWSHAKSCLRVRAPILAFGIYVGVQVLAAVFGIDTPLSFWSEAGRMTGVIALVHVLAASCLMAGVFCTVRQWESLLLASATEALL
jgi:hypothetical protein